MALSVCYIIPWYEACKRCRTPYVLSTLLLRIYKRTEYAQMKDRFPTTATNLAKLRETSLLSGGLRQWEFYLPFHEYIRARTGRDSKGRILFARVRQASEVRGRETLLEHLRTPACVHIAGKIA